MKKKKPEKSPEVGGGDGLFSGNPARNIKPVESWR